MEGGKARCVYMCVWYVRSMCAVCVCVYLRVQCVCVSARIVCHVCVVCVVCVFGGGALRRVHMCVGCVRCMCAVCVCVCA